MPDDRGSPPDLIQLAASLEEASHRELAGLLASVADAHALTDTQQERLRSAYESLSKYFDGHSHFGSITLEVHGQGSIVIGTTVRPTNAFHMDVDMVLRLVQGSEQDPPTTLLESTMSAGAEYARRYDLQIEPKRRCVQIQYADEMHVDLTPVIDAPMVAAYGDTHGLVPDRDRSRYLATNPKGYVHWFESVGTNLRPFVLAWPDSHSARAQITPLPPDSIFDRPLSVIVQLLKIHRNQFFSRIGCEVAPPSVFLTTLAALACADIAARNHSSPVELMAAIIDSLSSHIQIVSGGSAEPLWWLANPSAASENLADRMNADARRKPAFHAWLSALRSDFARLITSASSHPGIDRLHAEIRPVFGQVSADAVRRRIGDFVARERQASVVTSGTASAAVMGARPHTFFGD